MAIVHAGQASVELNEFRLSEAPHCVSGGPERVSVDLVLLQPGRLQQPFWIASQPAEDSTDDAALPVLSATLEN